MKKIQNSLLGLVLVLFFNITLTAQQAPAASDMPDTETMEVENTWKKLSRLTFKKQYDEMMGFKVDVPVFGKDIRAMEGKEFEVKGYVIPVEGYKSHKEFVFSAFPYNMCFFCGGAGPETVMEVVALEAVEYSPDAITLRGKIQLNDSDINRLIYSLTDAVVVEE